MINVRQSIVPEWICVCACVRVCMCVCVCVCLQPTAALLLVIYIACVDAIAKHSVLRGNDGYFSLLPKMGVHSRQGVHAYVLACSKSTAIKTDWNRNSSITTLDPL